MRNFTEIAFARSTKNAEDTQSHTEWRSLQEKGLLLFRDVKFVRTNFEATGLTKQTTLEDEVQESLISLYLKEE